MTAYLYHFIWVKVESRDVIGYLRFLKELIIAQWEVVSSSWWNEWNAREQQVGEARTKLGSTLKQVKRILSWVANALITPPESTGSGSCQWHWTYGPSVCLPHQEQSAILEDYSELFSLFGWQRYKLSEEMLLLLAWQNEHRGVFRLTDGTENTQNQYSCINIY